jgi:chromosome segregation ATPase
MSNENYVNYYIETLTSTLTDVIVRNVSLQATTKMHDDIVKDYEGAIEILKNELQNVQSNQNNSIVQLQEENKRLVDELSSIRQLKSEYENVKHQVQHIDTFRNELVRSRQENEINVARYESTIKDLVEQIDYLQMSPAKRKKYDELKSKEKITDDEINNTVSVFKDGGNF